MRRPKLSPSLVVYFIVTVLAMAAFVVTLPLLIRPTLGQQRPTATIADLAASPPVTVPASSSIPVGSPVPTRLASPFATPAQAIAISTAAAAAMASTGPSPEQWRLVFGDEFDGVSLDNSKWTPSFWWGNLKDGELQAYSAANLEFSDGQLRLRIDARRVDGRQYASGMISSHGKFNQQFGRFEMRARIPRGKGLWPAFWLALDKRDGVTWPPEIDIVETIGEDPYVIHMAHHFLDRNGQADLRQSNYQGPDFSAAFHTYGVEWNPDVSIWFIDGLERWRSRTDLVRGGMYVVVDLAIGDWAGKPDTTTPMPSYFDIDYVRVFQKIASGATPSPAVKPFAN